MPEDQRPEVVLTSPYVRARRTAEIVQAGGGLHVDVSDFLIDERLREKEFGILDRLTRRGIQERFRIRRSSGACSASSTTARPPARAGAT